MKVDASSVNKTDDVKGNQIPEPGTYLFVCKEAKEYEETTHAAAFEFEVIAGTVPAQETKTFSHKVWRDKDTHEEGREFVAKMLRMALALQLLKPKEVRNVDFNTEAPGRVCVATLEKRKGKDKAGNEKEFTNVADYGYAFWPVDDPSVSAVVNLPSAIAALKALGLSGGQQSPPPASGNGTPPADDWGSI